MLLKAKLKRYNSKSKKEETLITMIAGIYQKGLQVPDEWKGVESQIIANLGISLFASNKINEHAAQQLEEQPQEEEQGMEQIPQDQPME